MELEAPRLDEGTCQDDGVSEAVKTSTCDESDQTAASVDTRPTDDSESVEESKEETNDNATNGKSDDDASVSHVVIGPNEHPLQYHYCFWFSRRGPGAKGSAPANYEQNMKVIGTFGSVEQFWAHYVHMARPAELSGHCDFHLFKEGIKPLWEHDANKNGGKWMIRLRKGLASRFWEYLILAILGEQFMVGDELCGAVVSVRFQEDIISVWNRSADNKAVTERIRDTMMRVLNLPPNTVIEYKCHNASLKDRSSFRNTDVFVR
ncbi:eukaryotic translation initiation factor 4E type 2-like [Corticium candelabrum]|uniref:eukaryotic translation initiation factor 4E type 2-like n=1 Tax=Corticium candelabrum TaxID=121492 RepID=UPI002E277038|nr:eukaryotic translation initiation factor 4E type 2-like [Corticium candelabrum]